jgi:hypothetical protein
MDAMFRFAKDDIAGAKKWWRSLAPRKKKHYISHCKLNTEAQLVRFWLNSIKTEEV